MTDHALGWLVGIFEGEGTISVIAPKKDTHSARVSCTVSMTDEDVIQKFRTLSGVGRMYGPYKHAGNRKPYWQWHAHGRVAQRFLELVLPYLGQRRAARAREAIACKVPS